MLHVITYKPDEMCLFWTIVFVNTVLLYINDLHFHTIYRVKLSIRGVKNQQKTHHYRPIHDKYVI